MSAYRLTPLAKKDLIYIWRYIAQDNADAANRVEEAIHDACRMLAESPNLGRFQTDLTRRGVRFWTVNRFPQYVIIYNPKARPLRIVRIVHGARNLKTLLEGR